MLQTILTLLYAFIRWLLATTSPRTRRTELHVEALEPRYAPAPVPGALTVDYWTGNISNDWSVGGNWTPGVGVPGVNNRVILDGTNGKNPDPSFSGGKGSTIGGLQITEGFTNHTFTVDGKLTVINRFRMDAGTIAPPKTPVNRGTIWVGSVFPGPPGAPPTTTGSGTWDGGTIQSIPLVIIGTAPNNAFLLGGPKASPPQLTSRGKLEIEPGAIVYTANNMIQLNGFGVIQNFGVFKSEQPSFIFASPSPAGGEVRNIRLAGTDPATSGTMTFSSAGKKSSVVFQGVAFTDNGGTVNLKGATTVLCGSGFSSSRGTFSIDTAATLTITGPAPGSIKDTNSIVDTYFGNQQAPLPPLLPPPAGTLNLTGQFLFAGTDRFARSLTVNSVFTTATNYGILDVLSGAVFNWYSGSIINSTPADSDGAEPGAILIESDGNLVLGSPLAGPFLPNLQLLGGSLTTQAPGAPGAKPRTNFIITPNTTLILNKNVAISTSGNTSFGSSAEVLDVQKSSQGSWNNYGTLTYNGTGQLGLILVGNNLKTDTTHRFINQKNGVLTGAKGTLKIPNARNLAGGTVNEALVKFNWA